MDLQGEVQQNGIERKYKARLVAKSYAQTNGIDYEENFSLVAKMAMHKVMALIMRRSLAL